MKNPSAKNKKTPSNQFDPAGLTPADLESLAQFHSRRKKFEQGIEGSNIIYHKHICPACGFPTLNERNQYELCLICQWEDDGTGDQQELRVTHPIIFHSWKPG